MKTKPEFHSFEQLKAKHTAFRKECLKVMIAGVVTLAAGLILKTHVELGGVLAIAGIFGLGWAAHGLLHAMKTDTHFNG